MRTPSPPAEPSRSATAAALLELSQTPPQRATITHVGHGSPGTQTEVAVATTASEAAVQPSSPETPTNLKSTIHIFPSPMSESVDIAKVSNSDDENVGLKVCEFYYDTSGNQIDASQVPRARAVFRVEGRLPQFRPVVFSTPAPETQFAPGPAVTKRSNKAPTQGVSHASVGSEDGRHSMGVIEPAFDQPVGLAARLTEQRPHTQPIFTTEPDELESYLRYAASLGQQGYGASFRYASTPVHLPSQAPQQTRQRPLPFTGSTMGEQRLSQPPSQAQSVFPPTNIRARVPQQAKRSAPSTEELLAIPSSYGVVVPDRASSVNSEARKKVQISHTPPRAPPKRVRAPLKSQASTIPRDGFGQKAIDVQDLAYRSIKAINMPARNDLTPGQDPPEPVPDSQPYGDDIDFRASMLIWWCDDLELSYSETVRRYRLKFPDERTIAEDTVRKRHILYIEKLARRYGLKPQDELEEPGGWVARRGKQVGHKYNTINGVRVYSAAAGHDVAGTVRRRRVGAEPTQHRGFLKACICVWKDTSNVSFEQIKQRLKDEYSWNIGANTIQKLYYSERARVYNTHKESGTVDQQAPINTAEEDLEQLRVHFQQRQTYLLTTFGGQVQALDAVYMQQLKQLIDNMEQAQLQRVQQTGSGLIQTNHSTTEDEHDAEEVGRVEEVDDMMQDADTGIADNHGVD